ncbi:MAG TPA: amidohydrolase family protein [Clostridia bacterium]|nr:amidohydrolase family protein [Clostridia bacterium]
MKIDSHVHIMSPEIIANEEKYAQKDAYFKLIASSPKNKFATAEDVVAQLETQGFHRAAVCGFAFHDPDLCRFSNDYILEAIRNYPDRLIGLAAVNPLDRNLERELERCLTGGIRGVGELFPTGQGFSLEDQSQMERLSRFCQSHNLPVLVHVNELVGHYYPGKTSVSVKQAAVFAENNQELTIIFAHWGGGLFFYELMPEMRQILKNTYYDTAAGPFLYDHRIYDTARSIGVLGKVLMGSDFPLLSLTRYLKELERTSLDQREKELILGENARLLWDQPGGLE